MSTKIALISDDSNFFDFFKEKLCLRTADEIYSFSFDDVLDKIHLLNSAVLIINCEHAKDKTLELLKVFQGAPIIVCAYNEDTEFKKQCYRCGMFDFITLLTPADELQARLIPALSVAATLEKNKQYRNILVDNKIISDNNEVYINYELIFKKIIGNINNACQKAVLVAISPNDKSKYVTPANLIETIILANIRKNDMLINYAPCKYFLILLDVDVKNARAIWAKISALSDKNLYAGFCDIKKQKPQQLINKVLNELHEAIMKDNNENDIINDNTVLNIKVQSPYSNFKLFRQEFNKKLEQVINPVFYQMQQKYSGKLVGVTLQQGYGDGYGVFYIKGNSFSSCFKITSPGFSKINIDITVQKNSKDTDTKHITLEPEELEQGLLNDLLEQFVSEYSSFK